jgi:hypothetical protein
VGQTLRAVFIPTDRLSYATVSASVQLDVARQAQTIDFTALGDQTYGVAPLTLQATATSGLVPAFSVLSGPATVAGSTLTLTGIGTVVVAADQAGNENYSASPQVTRSFHVRQAGSGTGSGTGSGSGSGCAAGAAGILLLAIGLLLSLKLGPRRLHPSVWNRS